MSHHKHKNRFEDTSVFRLFLLLVTGGFIAIAIYAFQPLALSATVSILSVGLMIAGASFLLGGLIGFLFGIPRTLQQEGLATPDAEQQRDDKDENRGAAYKANTNLEQISDWLTKILVGVGLTQVSSLPEKLQVLSGTLSSGLGGFESSGIFSIAIITYFSICGFLVGYLWTRLYLAGAFKQADLGLAQFLPGYIASLDSVESQLDESGKQQIQELRNNAERKLASLSQNGSKSPLKKLKQYAKEYEQIRQSMRSGNERTFKMSSLMARVRASAIQAPPGPNEIITLFKTGSAGNRVVALNVLDIMRYSECFDIVVDAIGGSKSAFEQHVGLKAAENILAELNRDQKEKLAEVIGEQRSGKPGKYITPESDRWSLSERIIEAISPTQKAQ